MNKNTNEIRDTFINFFIRNQHKLLNSSSVVPDNDKTLLFTNAGMNQFKNIFLGLEETLYKRVVTVQKCIRAGGKHNDLENVGYTASHHTFFEMLGNFSFNDYFKEEAISFAWELLTGSNWFNLSKNRILVTVHNTDDESYNSWIKVGIKKCNIIKVGNIRNKAHLSDNFWQMGNTGPCGFCSEIFYINKKVDLNEFTNTKNSIEIWNLVFIKYNLLENGKIIPLDNQYIDTGMGLERISSILQCVNSNYDIDLFKNIINYIPIDTSKNINYKISLNIIADHIRSCLFIINDGVVPSNYGRGYVLRRIIRRAIIHINKLNIKEIFFYKLVKPTINAMVDITNSFKSKVKFIEKILYDEEKKFVDVLKYGLDLLEFKLNNLNKNFLDGDTAFKLYDTYGFPLELTVEICREKNIYVDKEKFETLMRLQRKQSNKIDYFNNIGNSFLKLNQETDFVGYKKLQCESHIIKLLKNNASVEIISENDEAILILDQTPFFGESGGQIGDTGKIVNDDNVFIVKNTKRFGNYIFHLGKVVSGKFKLLLKVYSYVDKEKRKLIQINHTATHLLYSALKAIIDKNIKQQGSLINDKYLRFDFCLNFPLKDSQIEELENFVNINIERKIDIKYQIFSKLDKLNEIKNLKIKHRKIDNQFVLRKLIIGNISKECCIGTHVKNTNDIKIFHITKEYGIASGIRRIEAITGNIALNFLKKRSNRINLLTKIMNCDFELLVNKTNNLLLKISNLEKQVFNLLQENFFKELVLYKKNIFKIKNINVYLKHINFSEQKIILNVIKSFKETLKSTIIILYRIIDYKINIFISITNDLINDINLKLIVSYIAQKTELKGGGSKTIAQIGGNSKITVSNLISIISEILNKII